MDYILFMDGNCYSCCYCSVYASTNYIYYKQMSIKEWVQIQNKLLWWELTGESWIPRNVKNSDGFKTDTTATTAEHVMSNERRHCTNCGISLIDGSFSITKKETKIRLCSKCFHIYCMEGE